MILPTLDKHIGKLRTLNKYRDIDHVVIYFIIYDHPGLWPLFIVAIAVHFTLGLKLRLEDSGAIAADDSTHLDAVITAAQPDAIHDQAQ
jgi:hypothetical protein